MGVKYVKDFEFPAEGGFHKDGMPVRARASAKGMPSRAKPNAPARGAAKMESKPKMGKGQGYAVGGKVQKFANAGRVGGPGFPTDGRGLPPKEAWERYQDRMYAKGQRAIEEGWAKKVAEDTPLGRAKALGRIGSGAAAIYGGYSALRDLYDAINANKKGKVTVEEIDQPQGRARGGMMKKHMAAKGRMKNRK
jgi:hypothetical protein